MAPGRAIHDLEWRDRCRLTPRRSGRSLSSRRSDPRISRWSRGCSTSGTTHAQLGPRAVGTPCSRGTRRRRRLARAPGAGPGAEQMQRGFVGAALVRATHRLAIQREHLRRQHADHRRHPVCETGFERLRIQAREDAAKGVVARRYSSTAAATVHSHCCPIPAIESPLPSPHPSPVGTGWLLLVHHPSYPGGQWPRS